MAKIAGYVEVPSSIIKEQAPLYIKRRRKKNENSLELYIDIMMQQKNLWPFHKFPVYRTREDAIHELKHRHIFTTYDSILNEGSFWIDAAKSLIAAANFSDTVLVEVSYVEEILYNQQLEG